MRWVLRRRHTHLNLVHVFVITTAPLTRDLVLVGGGHAHALLLRAWGMNPLPGARLTLINPGPTAPYTGMLPGHVAGHYTREMLEIDLVRLCRHAGARLILDHVTSIDRQARRFYLQERGPVAYDIASINIGITAKMDLPGFVEHAMPAKPLDVFAERWREFLKQASKGDIAPNIAVIGGGVAGCELAMAMAYALRERDVEPRVTIIQSGAQISGMGTSARRRVLAVMGELGIVVRANARVTRVEADRVVIDGEAHVAASLCIGAAGAFPHRWIANCDLPQRKGFIEIGTDLGVRGDEALFAVGDCAVMLDAERPKAGVFAVRAAPFLHYNLRAALTGEARKPWRPQKNYLKLIALGGKSALAEKFGRTLEGPLLWRWKDRIDAKFMDKLRNLPPMPQPASEGAVTLGVSDMLADIPLCGGCGAKVGQGVLSGALSTLQAPHGDVVAGAGDDAAVLRQPDGSYQVISTDHLRAAIADPAMMTRIAAVHALGDIWAMGATPQVALASIIIPHMSVALQKRTMSEITQAATDVFDAAGAQLVGGHSTMGAELTIGFTVTGTRANMPLTVGGAKAGDALLLTRPIGTGVILAADMAGRADGRVVAAVHAIMATPQQREAVVLARVAHAMTDVTGFGLAGHVFAIARASRLDAQLTGDAIPYYDGARALSDAGVSSSLMAANQADAPVEGLADALLHDPQTSGGLLAAVPQAQVGATLDALTAAGCVGHVIGHLVKPTDRGGRLHVK